MSRVYALRFRHICGMLTDKRQVYDDLFEIVMIIFFIIHKS